MQRRRRSMAVKAALGTVALSGAAVLLAAPADAVTWTGGSFSCGPDQTVVLSFSLNHYDSAGLYWQWTSGGVLFEGSHLWWDGTTHSWNTGRRGISYWKATSRAAGITYAGPSCA